MRFWHVMVRVSNLEESLDFYCKKLGMIEVRRMDLPERRFGSVYVAPSEDLQQAMEADTPILELTYLYDAEEFSRGRNFGHLAFKVQDLYAICQKLMDADVTIVRPPRDGRLAFIKSPDGISIELSQEGEPLPICEPWASMENQGVW